MTNINKQKKAYKLIFQIEDLFEDLFSLLFSTDVQEANKGRSPKSARRAPNEKKKETLKAKRGGITGGVIPHDF